MDPGAFICAGFDFPGEIPIENCDGSNAILAAASLLIQSIYDSRILTDAASSKGAEVCDFMRARASNLELGFLYNQRVRVR
jgi:hypothetical protein